jgi:hypothetical protein
VQHVAAAFELARSFDADDAVRLDDVVRLFHHADDGGSRRASEQ